MDPFIEARKLARKLKTIDAAVARKAAEAEERKQQLLREAPQQVRDLVVVAMGGEKATEAAEEAAELDP